MTTNTNQNLIILDVEETIDKSESKTLWQKISESFSFFSKISLRDKVVFFRIMATMTNASMTVLKSLVALRRQEKKKKMQKFYDYIIEQIQSGKTLNESLRSYGDNFSDAECSIIEAGERTGKLNQGLAQVAEQVEKMDSISRKLRGAMIYPIVLILGMIIVVVVLMVKVIPMLLQFFWDPTLLPPTTQMIMAMSDFFSNYWHWLVIFSIFLGIFYRIWKRTAEGKYLNDKMILHIPIVGMIVKKVILSRFSRVFSNLIGSGVAIVEAIRIVASSVGNEVYRQRILLLRQDIKSGKKMAESLEDDPMFPELLVSMLRVGEETAQIGQVVVKIADFYDEEVDIAVNSIQKLIEPVILVVMGVVITFIAIGVMQPMMNMASNIGA